MKHLAVFSFLFLFCISHSAFSISLAVEAIGDYTVQKDNLPVPPPISHSNSAELGTGAGLILGKSIMGPLDLELGAKYYKNVSTQTYADPSVTLKYTITWHTLEVPIGVRFWLAKFVSFGVGGYYQKFFGDANLQTETTTQGSTSSQSRAASMKNDVGYQPANWGAYGSAALDFGLSGPTSIFVEGRYNAGIRDVSTVMNGYVLKLNNTQGIAGFRFRI